VNTYILDSADMFDFNTQPYEEVNCFKANIIRLDIPREAEEDVYYFIHKSLYKI
jgi:hypothetical protein